jgi:hypothetical protein
MSTMFWDVASCNLVEVYRRFGETYCPIFMGKLFQRRRFRDFESGKTKLLPTLYFHRSSDLKNDEVSLKRRQTTIGYRALYPRTQYLYTRRSQYFKPKKVAGE